MPYEEQHLRMQRMRLNVKAHNIYRWATDLISGLAEIRLEASEFVEKR